jgi:TrpR family trp operon transcriptional repressor
MNRIGELSQVLAGIKDPALIEGFLEAILTPHELQDLSGRWELVKRLDQGVSQRTIAQELGMSLCKITRGSKELKRPGSALKRVVEEFLRPEEIDTTAKGVL